MEELVKPVESWPMYIIMHVFVGEPCAHMMKKVAAFMYGNEVPVETAAMC
jgi:hypothetical protein